MLCTEIEWRYMIY